MVISNCRKCGRDLHIFDVICTCGERRPRQVHPFFMALAAIFIGLPVLLILFGPEDGSANTQDGMTSTSSVPRTIGLEIPSGTNARTAAIVNAAWPKIINACPGISAYIDDLWFKGIEDYMIDAAEFARVDVVVEVAATPKFVPARYRAAGNTCRFGISPDGMSLRIQKEACVAICTQEQVNLGGEDYVRPL